MKNYIKHHPWHIIEEGFDPHVHKISESIFSIGNGHMGQRANFEEQYTGETLQGSYVAGVYYPDKTRVGWWKNGYPEYFAKVLNAPSWIGIGVVVDGQPLDLATGTVENFVRVLNMREGVLQRTCDVTLTSGKSVRIEASRFCSLQRGEVGAIRYSITPLNFSGDVDFTVDVNADIVNKDANYDEKFWIEVERSATPGHVRVTAATKKTDFHVSTAITYRIEQQGKEITPVAHVAERYNYAANVVRVQVKQGEETVLYKYAAVISSQNHAKQDLAGTADQVVHTAASIGYQKLWAEHAATWEKKWELADIVIEGDIAAQQGIRFNIFQLMQTYTGDDARLNIGPKGFTGEKYGGSTYWDTEAYCLPFFLSTADPEVARNLLVYRYRQLDKAIDNAAKLGFVNGAALYPMVTMNGEECHNEWEITFEEIHRNGAIAYAIFDYVRYTGDESYLAEYGLEVLIALSRFWAQRVNWSEARQQFVILGVTGPNEYENNVDNNWYTNRIAQWTLRYTMEVASQVKRTRPEAFRALADRVFWDSDKETANWKTIADGLYFPEDETRGVFLQQDGFLDKTLLTVNDLSPADRPINQKWSWDRILRSCFIKQADVLQGLYFFEDEFDTETLRRNFDFYEPMTVHESSLSPCVHAILASRLGYEKKAYEMYLRTSRLDLDDYNNDTEDGCHITSMAGTWMSVVKGFGGMRVRNGQLYLAPFIPRQWSHYSFRIEFRGRVLKIKVSASGVEAVLHSGEPLTVFVHGESVWIESKVVLSKAV
jgi:maltose phosphorylase